MLYLSAVHLGGFNQAKKKSVIYTLTRLHFGHNFQIPKVTKVAVKKCHFFVKSEMLLLFPMKNPNLYSLKRDHNPQFSTLIIVGMV